MNRLTYIIALSDTPPYIREMATRHKEIVSKTGTKELQLFDAHGRLTKTFIGYKWVFITDSFGDWVAQIGQCQVCPVCHKPQTAAKPGKAAKFEYQLGDDDYPVLHCQHCHEWSRLELDWKADILTMDTRTDATIASGDTSFDVQDILSPPQVGIEGRPPRG